MNGGEERKRGGGGVSSRQSSKEDLCICSKFFDARSVVEDCLLLGIIFREEEVEINSISYTYLYKRGGGDNGIFARRVCKELNCKFEN